MAGFIDLHSHWVAGIDDGARTTEDGRALLLALRRAGFEHVVATPHMRPGMFDNSRARIIEAFERTRLEVGASLSKASDQLPSVGLGSEHFLDDVVFARLLAGDALPYPGGHAALIEFPVSFFPARVDARLRDLRRNRLIPVIAHPERYEPVWKDIRVLDPLLDAGAVLLLDVAALDGKYGRAPRKAADALVSEGYYHAACSDAHKASDVEDVQRGIALLFERAGHEEASFLLGRGPREILEGKVAT